MKIVVLGGFAESLVRFRGPLLAALVEAGHKVIACAPEFSPDIAERIQKLGATCRPIPLERAGLNLFKDLGFLLRLARIFRKEQPDMLFCYTIKPVIYGSLAARWAGVSAIFSMITGLGYTFSGHTLRRRLLTFVAETLYRLALAGNQVVFFQNPDDRALFLQRKLVRDQNQTALVNGSGVDIDYYAETPVPSGLPVFVLIARMLRDKGVVEYVEAARILKRKHPHATFRLIGPVDINPASLRVEQLEAWCGEGVIEYQGWVHDVRPLLAAASVFVLPSYREGTPRTVLEAMSMGRPIVTTNAPGCRETVSDGENGFLVSIKDVDALAYAMERFILCPELIERMGKRSRALAEQKFDVHGVNRVLLRAMGLAGEMAPQSRLAGNGGGGAR